jgi:hypothetical protein
VVSAGPALPALPDDAMSGRRRLGGAH